MQIALRLLVGVIYQQTYYTTDIKKTLADRG